MPLHVRHEHVPGFPQWSEITAGKLWVYDGGTWRLLKELHVYDGTAWRKVYSGSLTPIGLTATNTGSSPFFSVDLAWSHAPGKSGTAMVLEREINGSGSWTTLTAPTTGSTSAVDAPPSANTYRYRLRYTDEADWAFSNPVAVT